MSLLQVSFPGGQKVDARIGEFTVKTDQPLASGGENSAPSPFDLFLASLANCAGIYALRFCQSKEISTDGLKLEMDGERDSETGLYSKIKFKLTLPDSFPSKYEKPIIRAMSQCTVKKHLANPPEIDIDILK